MVEVASTQSDGIEITEMDEAASTQADCKESTEMVKASSFQSDIQIKIQKKRKGFAEDLDKLKDASKNLVSEKEAVLSRLVVTAIVEENVKVLEDYINKNLEALLASRIDEFGCTIFHYIVQVPGMNGLIEKLVSMVSPESLAQRDIDGDTALHSAAICGNTKAVELFVNKNRNLLSIKNNNDFLPVDYAIESGRHRETVEHLLSAHAAGEKKFDGEFLKKCAYILCCLIRSDHIDLAFGFLNQHLNLADRRENIHWNETINELVRKDMRLPRGTWQRLIYHCISVEIENHKSISKYGDIENQIQTSQKKKFFPKLQYKLWNALLPLGIYINH